MLVTFTVPGKSMASGNQKGNRTKKNFLNQNINRNDQNLPNIWDNFDASFEKHDFFDKVKELTQ